MNGNSGGCRTRPRMWSARAGLLAVVAVTALLTVACGGGSTSAPGVASLGPGNHNGGGHGNSASGSDGSAAQLLDEWATCIRGQGDPNQADPTIDSNKDIEITMINVSQTLEHEVHGMVGPCSNYLVAASKALSGGQPQPTDNPAQDVKFADCMRANGFPNWPDPSNGGTNFNGTGIDPNSPAAQRATKTCDEKVGEPYFPPSYEVPGVVIETGCSGVPAGTTTCPTPPANATPGSCGSNGRCQVINPGSGGNG
jgi:hypothetical protein